MNQIFHTFSGLVRRDPNTSALLSWKIYAQWQADNFLTWTMINFLVDACKIREIYWFLLKCLSTNEAYYIGMKMFLHFPFSCIRASLCVHLIMISPSIHLSIQVYLSGGYLLSPWPSLGHTSPTEWLLVKGDLEPYF